MNVHQARPEPPMKTPLKTAFLVVIGSLAGCSTVKYDDPGKVESLTIDWGSTDLQTLAAGMIESLVAAPQLAYIEQAHKGDDKRILSYFGGIENRTSEHIDTATIKDKIETQLLKSGKFRIAAGKQGQNEIGEQVRFQQGSGRVDPVTARAFGKQVGADVVIYGTL